MACDEEYIFRPFDLQKCFVRGKSKPQPRSGHRVVATEESVFSIGGYTPSESNQFRADGTSRQCLIELWEYNVSRATWRLVPMRGDVPRLVISHTADLVNGRTLLIQGGTSVPFAQSLTNDIFACDLIKRDPVTGHVDWFRLPTTGHDPPQLYGQASIVLDGCFYIVGGTDGYLYSASVYRLDLRTLRWEVLHEEEFYAMSDECTRARYRHELAAWRGDPELGTTLLMLGGGTPQLAMELKTLDAFSIDQRRWVTVETKPDPRFADLLVDDGDEMQGFPERRRCHTVTRNGNLVFICGGTDGETAYQDVWCLDLTTLRWRVIDMATFEPPVWFHAAALAPDKFAYFFGGIIDSVDNTRTDALTSMAVDVPPLGELAWRATLHYAPQIRDFDQARLRDLGIPVMFRRRLAFDGQTTELIGQQLAAEAAR